MEGPLNLGEIQETQKLNATSSLDADSNKTTVKKKSYETLGLPGWC